MEESIQKHYDGISLAYQEYREYKDSLDILPEDIAKEAVDIDSYYTGMVEAFKEYSDSAKTSAEFANYYQTICYLEDVMDTLLSDAPPPPKDPYPSMQPPYEIVYSYELKYSIHRHTANLLFSIFDCIYFDDTKPIKRILCKYPIDIPSFHANLLDLTKQYSLRSFDTVCILPFYTMVLYV